MAVLAEERARPTLVELAPVADPAPLGLAAFALTTFLLGGHNATFIPDAIWTAFSTYGGFWLALGTFVVMLTNSGGFSKLVAGSNEPNALAWFLLTFAIFNTYMLLWATRVNL